MSRRGEVPFVASRVGRSYDTRECLGLAAQLKIERATALGFLTLWEEFILEVGDSLTGRVSGYEPIHLAEKLGWKGQARKLVDALKKAGVLRTHRGVFIHPYWGESITGQYAIDKAEQRERWRVKKRDQRNGDVPEMSPGQPGDVPETSLETTDIKKERNGTSGAAPPPSPPRAGGSLGASRWEWLKSHHKRPANSRSCIRYLDLISEADWTLCQWVLGPPPLGGASYSLSKKRVFRLDAHKFLATEAYLQFLPEWTEKLDREKRPAPTVARAVKQGPTEAEQLEAKEKHAREFLLALLADPELDEGTKDRRRALWRREFPGRPVPGEDSKPPALDSVDRLQ